MPAQNHMASIIFSSLHLVSLEEQKRYTQPFTQVDMQLTSLHIQTCKSFYCNPNWGTLLQKNPQRNPPFHYQSHTSVKKGGFKCKHKGAVQQDKVKGGSSSSCLPIHSAQEGLRTPHILDQNTFLEIQLYTAHAINQSFLSSRRRLQKIIPRLAKPLHSSHFPCFSPFHYIFLCLTQESSSSQIWLSGDQSQGDTCLLALDRCEHCRVLQTALDLGPNNKYMLRAGPSNGSSSRPSPFHVFFKGMISERRSLV